MALSFQANAGINLDGVAVTEICSTLFGKDHIWRKYNRKGKLIKQTRNWHLDNLYAAEVKRLSKFQP
jgi:hypothetical protein